MRDESKLEAARPEDGPALLALIEEQAAAGDLSLLYTRRPDPVVSILSESSSVSLGVIRDKDGVPRFMESSTERRVYWGGEVRTLPYIGNVRKQAGALPATNWLKALCAYEGARHSLAFCSILEGNEGAARIFCRRQRAYAPRLHPLCGYRTFLFSPHAVKGRTDTGFFRMSQRDRGELLDFLRRQGRSCTLFPAVEDLEREFYGLKMEDFYGIRQNGTLAACGALWDQRPFRQYIVKEYRGLYALARRAPLLTRLLGYIPLPTPGAVVDVRVLTLLCAQDSALFRPLLAGLAGAADCPILAAGAAEGHPWHAVYSSLRSVSFGSTIYTMEMPDSPSHLPPADRPVHLEVGWL